ncbi:trypsin eta [Drosophila guanche]|uniref:trypsin eta n=1 Tax=Drosophila guanche TaxID=7266 RepID=UPI0014711B73|nr:trypsin eta [Drosophila guanche]
MDVILPLHLTLAPTPNRIFTMLQHGNGNGDYGNTSEFHFLITGGYRPETNNLVKYVVSVRTNRERKFFGDNHFCGGAVVSSTVILTAAHCLYSGTTRIKASRMQVVAGTPRRLQRTGQTQVRDVHAAKPHPKYTPKRLKNDIGLLLLKKPLNPNGHFVQIIPLSTATPQPGLKCTVVGWGTVIQFGPTPDEAVNGDVSVNDNAFCDSLEGFGKGMICASDAADHEVDSCQGDSGGPLMCDNIVVGVVSFGAGCGEPNSAGVYSNVYYFRDWIKTNSSTRYEVAVNLQLLLSQLLLLLIHGNQPHIREHPINTLDQEDETIAAKAAKGQAGILIQRCSSS